MEKANRENYLKITLLILKIYKTPEFLSSGANLEAVLAMLQHNLWIFLLFWMEQNQSSKNNNCCSDSTKLTVIQNKYYPLI